MKVGEMYTSNSEWLKAGDLNGKKVRVTVESVEVVEFKEGKKAGLRFRGKQKGLVLNKTNAQVIAKQHGEDMDDWVGKEIAIYPTTTDFQGDQVECIRVEQHIPEADPDDDLPW